jgi:DHA3 family macrolide efflux protein-like MFS transporter
MSQGTPAVGAQRGAQHGMAIFSLIWFGQVISLLGSGLTEFGLGVWVFQRTGAATDYALIALCISLPQVLVAPLAGTVVDRTDRRLVMLLSDSGAAISTLMVALLAWTGQLETWHVYAAVLAVQYPAYAALVSQLVPQERLGRANGMIEMAWSGSMIAAPLLAATLIEYVSLSGVLVVDLLTFCVGAGTLLLARTPGGIVAEAASSADGDATPSFMAQTREGWQYLATRRGLTGLLTFSAIISLSAGSFNALFVPMVLSTETPAVLGGLASIGGLGMLAGGLLLAAWGGPRRRMVGVIGASLLFGVALTVIGMQPSWLALAVAVAVYFGCQPFLNGCEQTIWQTTVPLGLQGRVLSVRRAVEHGAAMVAYLVAGPIADHLVSPLLAPGGVLTSTVGTLIGTGPGRGIGLLLVVMGLVALLVTLVGSLLPRIRQVEDDLPAASDEVPGLAVEQVRLEPAA